MPQLFGSHVRLRSRAEFTAVQERGRRVSTAYFTMLALSNARECDRLGIIASRRLGNAVVRNRAKRRVREIFRGEAPDQTRHDGAPYVDLVVIPRRELISAPFANLQTSFRAAVGKLRRAR
jgi:ribonuclease P protein component